MILCYGLRFGQKEGMETERPDSRNVRCNLDFLRKQLKGIDTDGFKFLDFELSLCVECCMFSSE